MHVPVSCTINYNIQALRNSKLSLLSAGGISSERDQLCDLYVTPGETHGIFLTSHNVCAGEVPLLSARMVTNFDSDIRLDFLTHHNSPGEQDNIMFSPDVLRYMHKTVLKEEEEEQRKEIAAKEKLPGIFEGNSSKAENFIYEFAAYFMAHDDKPVLASPVARVALNLSRVKGEEVDQWVDQQLQWLELQDQQDPRVRSAFVEAFFEQFVPKGRWQSIVRIEMKWPYIDEYISDFKKAYIHSKQPLKGINQAQRFIKGLAGSVKRAMADKFQTYKKAKKQASHIVGIQKLLHQASKKRSETWTNAQGQLQKTLRPTTPKKPTSRISICKEQKRLKKVRQGQQRAAERKRGLEAHLYGGNPSMSLNSPMSQKAMGEVQMNKPNPTIIDTTTPSIDDLCTQLESLMLNEREEVINCLHIA